MYINLSTVFSQDEKVYYFEGKIEDEDLNNLTEEFSIVEPIHYKGEIYRVQREYLVNADIKYTYTTRCDRCLKTIEKDAKTTLSGKLTHDDLDEFEEDENLLHYKNNKLDIEKYILMEVVSSLPMKSLCDEECKGICSICGKDLNDGECDCEKEDIDPRFEKLKNFFEEE